MSIDPLEARLAVLARSVFGLGPSDGLEGLAYKCHPRWDSLGHIQLVLAVEKEFRVKLSSQDLVSIQKIADIGVLLREKYGVKP
jgi:hypothetical protein